MSYPTTRYPADPQTGSYKIITELGGPDDLLEVTHYDSEGNKLRGYTVTRYDYRKGLEIANELRKLEYLDKRIAP
jgi:hypothetical protein